MKFFNLIQKSFENIGIHRHQTFENHSINLRNSSFLAIFALNIILEAVFLQLEANTFGEYSECLYVTVTFIYNIVIVEELVRKTLNIYQLITNFGNTIQKREYYLKKIKNSKKNGSIDFA